MHQDQGMARTWGAAALGGRCFQMHSNRHLRSFRSQCGRPMSGRRSGDATDGGRPTMPHAPRSRERDRRQQQAGRPPAEALPRTGAVQIESPDRLRQALAPRLSTA